MNAVRRGFSLIELMVVMLIIALVIAIVVPTLSGVRTRAKEADTRNLTGRLSQAMTSFQLDQRRLPGYFNASEMGSPENAARGLTQAQNVLIDLAGGLVANGGLEVGPLSAATTHVRVEPSLIGAASGSNKSYFAPERKFFKIMFQAPSGENRVGEDVHARLPDLIDSFGTPFLMWVADPVASGEVGSFDDIARENSGGGNPTPSRFYWQSNGAWLATGAATVGPRRVEQFNNVTGSLLGQGTADRVRSLAGIMGNPGSPKNPTANTNQILPTAARGSFVIQSAGADGAFLGLNDKGGKLANNGPLHYGLNFKNAANVGLRTGDDKPTSTDLATLFDDVLQSGS